MLTIAGGVLLGLLAFVFFPYIMVLFAFVTVASLGALPAFAGFYLDAQNDSGALFSIIGCAVTIAVYAKSIKTVRGG